MCHTSLTMLNYVAFNVKCRKMSCHIITFLFSYTQSADGHTERQTDRQTYIYTMRGSVSVLNSIRRQEDKFHGNFAESL